MDGGTIKHSYTVPCSAAFRDGVERLAARRRVNVGDLARSVMLTFSSAAIAEHPDPGEPGPEDREIVVVKSGPAQGRPWRRKPRLQMRLPPGCEVPTIRRALALALALDEGRLAVRLDDGVRVPAPPDDEALEELERLRALVSVLSFDPLPDGVRGREDALHVLGFPPRSAPDQRALRAKFRMLAMIHHPDSRHGSHQRMSQLNAAMEILRPK